MQADGLGPKAQAYVGGEIKKKKCYYWRRKMLTLPPSPEP